MVYFRDPSTCDKYFPRLPGAKIYHDVCNREGTFMIVRAYGTGYVQLQGIAEIETKTGATRVQIYSNWIPQSELILSIVKDLQGSDHQPVYATFKVDFVPYPPTLIRPKSEPEVRRQRKPALVRSHSAPSRRPPPPPPRAQPQQRGSLGHRRLAGVHYRKLPVMERLLELIREQQN